jgi:GMC oxidoreductase
MAVVNQYRQLRAISNLRVVDASVGSAIPRTNINLTCIMIGSPSWKNGCVDHDGARLRAAWFEALTRVAST